MSNPKNNTSPVEPTTKRQFVRLVETPYGFVAWHVEPYNGKYVLLTGRLNGTEIGAQQIDNRASRQAIRKVALKLNNEWSEAEAQHREDVGCNASRERRQAAIAHNCAFIDDALESINERKARTLKVYREMEAKWAAEAAREGE
jgi:hypothetical protein